MFGSEGFSGQMCLMVLVGLSFLGVPDVTGLTRRHSSTDYIEDHHIHTLNYNPEPVHAEHVRHKRSVPPTNGESRHKVRLDFMAHGRRFMMDLERDHSVFHNDLRILDQDENSLHHAVDTSHIYEGKLVDDPKSHCFGAIRDGVFDGQIVTREGVYYVERASRFPNLDLVRKSAFSASPPSSNRSSSIPEREVHSVIYHEKNVKDPWQHSTNKFAAMAPPGCGVSDSTAKWMSDIQSGEAKDDSTKEDATGVAEGADEEDDSKEDDDDIAVEAQLPPIDPNESPFQKYTAAANDPKRRAKRSLENTNKRKSCSLYIQTDPLFWKHVREQEPDDAKTQEEILSLIAQHVKAVNRIYSDTPFDGKYKHNGYQFEVQRIKIHNESQCKSSGRVTADQNQFCIPNVDVSNFLNLHSKSNHEEFCLAYVFTYRDFTGGTLGLAWVASATGASGGICETYKRYTENINGVHHTAKRSLNTGIITFVNYNSRVPPKVSQLTLAHEIGHNFGSPHDYPQECRPGGLTGNFIMFASATSGDRDNNNKFSECSKSNVSAVLDAITDGRKPNCFTESDGAFCGNKIVEDGEECDCGFDDNECTESCCYPRKSADQSEEENKKNRCRRRPNTECSPSEGPCCSQSCRFIQNFEAVQCKHEDDCTMAAVCDGRQAPCPRPMFKQDNTTECNEGTQVCQEGECKSSICLKYGLESCFLTSELVSDKRELCELACRRSGGNNTCMSTHQLVREGLIRDLEEGLDLRPGSPCDNFQGYCDVFLKCRKVDAEGPLVRLKNLFFNQANLLTIAQWVTEFWWAVLLIGIAVVICMAIFIRCFAIHTPSSNPNLPKNLHFSETLRRPVRSLQQKHYRQAPSAHSHSGGHGPSQRGGYHEAGYNPSSAASSGAPPPYPGPGGSRGAASGSSSGGPGHGYGEGRGHYNRSRSHEASAAAIGGGGFVATPAAAAPSSSRGGGGSGNPDRRSAANQNRASRIEMQPTRR